MSHQATARARAAISCALAALALTAGAAGAPLAAQTRDAAPSFRIRESATLDLWYHGLATVGFESFGPYAYYAPGYADAQRRRKGARGIAPTAIERDAVRLHATFERDSAFEVLHFVPLYFAEVSPELFLAAVRAIAGTGSLAALPAPQRAGAAAIRGVLPRAEQRAVLAAFTADLEEDWRLYLRDELARGSPARQAAREALQRRWNEVFAPTLQTPLSAADIRSAQIYLVPSLGPEGRIVDAAVLGDGPVVAVWWPALSPAPPAGASPDAPAFAAVRELCFPLIRSTSSPSPPQDRAAAVEASERAAFACGARLLGDGGAQATAYRETFSRAAKRVGTARR